MTVRPGAGIAEAVEEDYRTNLPPRLVRGARPVDPLVTVSHPGVVVEAVKLAEDGSGDLIVRLYESRGTRTAATVAGPAQLPSITVVDLLERAKADTTPAAGSSIELTLRPFELVTLRFGAGVDDS